ncbi:S-adenosyl-L-methionine-dependent methyltransferase [Gigaspora margarita]|uniref:S-adenosyl-L-methionine-dependent methyltransferase n=1 Tax=Gigaspora margarita TaxID=4874 RepID=A0A8H4AUB6_GIGMA|nr:S-adenosyl-L-methionine-dependent methyltransferase [Gigaspora margarita]
MGNNSSVYLKHLASHKSRNSGSQKSNISNFQHVDGRKFHNIRGSSYSMPVDEEECDRLQIQHFLFRCIWKGNFSAPIKDILENGGHILDVGCGPGTWVLDMATEYPKAKFTAIDMVPVYPSEIKPPNVTFIQSNILEGLPFKDNEFDYVHMQNAAFNFTEKQWIEKVLVELIRVLKVDGWCELCELDQKIINIPPKFLPLYEACIQLGRSKGINLEIAPSLGELLRGYTHSNKLSEIHHDVQTLLHYEHGAGRAGKISRENALMFYRTIAPMILSILHITQEEYDSILESAEEDWEINECYNYMHRFFVKKKC